MTGRVPMTGGDSAMALANVRPRCHVTYFQELVPYADGLRIQAELSASRRSGPPDRLLLLEHPHTYTLGRNADVSHVLMSTVQMARLGAQVFHIDRGGDVTYHGPGQLVGYPIFQLRDHGIGAHDYLRALEQVLILTLREFGVVGGREEGFTGVWVDGAKVAAIGIKITGGVTTHGFAFNICTDLSMFGHIVPCGIVDRPVVSLEQLVGRAVTVSEVVPVVVRCAAEVFDLDMMSVEAGEWMPPESYTDAYGWIMVRREPAHGRE